MKKRFTALFLALALCLGSAVPAFAADDTAAKAIAAYQQVMASPPSLKFTYTSYQYDGGFYLDFDQNGVPELVLVYKDVSFSDSDWAMLVYYYNGTAQRITKGYPDVYTRSYSNDMLITSWGGSGGSTGNIVRFSDGTYGLQQYAFGFDTTKLTAKFSGSAFVSAGNSGTTVYNLGGDPLPSPNKFYTPSTTPTQPTQPTGGSADFELWENGTIMADYYGPGGRVTVPSTVTEIRDPHTRGAYDSITELVLPSGLKQISDYAFMDCSKLTTINLPSGLETIKEDAFCGAGLTSVTIPASVTIERGAFNECPLVSVSYELGRKRIEGGSFFGFDKLTTVTIPASVTYIGPWSFSTCISLTKVVIENGNAEIGEYNFINIDATGAESKILGNLPVTIYSQPGGAVERYCKANGIPFQPLGSGTANQFTDVAAGQWYAAPVTWAVEKGITNGTSATKFSPSQTCTHAQILTFLYRAERGGTAAPEDMDKAVSWARDKGLIDEGFDGGRPCTRAEAVHYIWQAQGRPEAKAAAGFTDVAADADYAKAVSWAVEKGVTNGSNAEGTTFSPDVICTRGHIVTFLHRGMN